MHMIKIALSGTDTPITELTGSHEGGEFQITWEKAEWSTDRDILRGKLTGIRLKAQDPNLKIETALEEADEVTAQGAVIERLQLDGADHYCDRFRKIAWEMSPDERQLAGYLDREGNREQTVLSSECGALQCYRWWCGECDEMGIEPGAIRFCIGLPTTDGDPSAVFAGMDDEEWDEFDRAVEKAFDDAE